MRPTAGRLMGNGCGWWHGGRREPLQIAPWKVNDVLGLAIDLDEGADAAAHRAARTDHAVQGPRSCVLGPGLVNFVLVLFCSQINLVDGRPFRIQSHQKRHFETFLGVRLRPAYFCLARRKPTRYPAASIQWFLSDASGQRHLEAPATSAGTKSGAAGSLPGATEGPSKGSNCHILAKNDEKIGPNPAEKMAFAGLML